VRTLTFFSPKPTCFVNCESESAPDPVLSDISDLLMFVDYFTSRGKGIKFDDYFVDVCCADMG